MEIGVQSSSTPLASKAGQLVLFGLEDQRYALYLSAVEQIARMVEITPLPHSPAIILGVVNLQGRVIPVFDIRGRFRLPKRETGLSDHLIIASTRNRTVALAVDACQGVATLTSREMIPVDRIFPGLDYVQGVTKLEDGLVLIHDLDTFLSGEEEDLLEKALHDRRPA